MPEAERVSVREKYFIEAMIGAAFAALEWKVALSVAGERERHSSTHQALRGVFILT